MATFHPSTVDYIDTNIKYNDAAALIAAIWGATPQPIARKTWNGISTMINASDFVPKQIAIVARNVDITNLAGITIQWVSYTNATKTALTAEPDTTHVFLLDMPKRDIVRAGNTNKNGLSAHIAKRGNKWVLFLRVYKIVAGAVTYPLPGGGGGVNSGVRIPTN